MDASQRRAVVERAVAFLAGAQGADGSFAVHARRRGGDALEAPDPSPFVTALVARGLESAADASAAAPLERALDALAAGAFPGGVWKHWARGHPRAASLPPDADDTACAIELLARRRGWPLAPSAALLAACRSRDGRFRTWLLPRGFDPRAWRARARSRQWSEFAAAEHAFWTTTEAKSDDVDAGVNANVILALGTRRATARAARWLAERIAAGDEREHEKWHRHPWAVAFFAARAGERHPELAAGIRPALATRLAAARAELVATGDALALALAGATARSLALPGETVAALLEALASRQRPDGAFARGELYFGGPRESVGWGSPALTTGIALSALGPWAVTE